MKKRVNILNRPKMLTLDFDEDDLPLEGNEKIKLEPEETIAEILKLIPQERKKNRNRIKILTADKLLTRLPILLARWK